MVIYPVLNPNKEPAKSEYAELGKAGKMILIPLSINIPKGAQIPMFTTALRNGSIP